MALASGWFKTTVGINPEDVLACSSTVASKTALSKSI